MMQADPFRPQTPLSVPGWQTAFASQQPAQQAPPGVQPRLVVSQISGPFSCGTQQPFGHVSGPQGILSRQVPVSLLQVWFGPHAKQAIPPPPHCWTVSPG